ncbi:MAG TPA: PfkB family carbohydrate kinase [Planctomycetota bacterium]|nr:PfkB family carbohydrate kinase [Planctomycetota bacterium]
MRLVTLTLHPAIDRIFSVEKLVPGATFDGSLLRCVPAGKGVNTARSLSSVVEPRAVLAAAWVGRAEETWFREWLRQHAKISVATCPRECATRSAYTILEPSGRETHIKEAMAAPPHAEERALLAFWKKTVKKDDVVALCGSAPRGTKRQTLEALFAAAREHKARCVIADTNGVALEVAASAGLNGIKGNALEIGQWLKLDTKLDLSRKPHRLALQKAFARVNAPQAITITLGKAGAILATHTEILRAVTPTLPTSAVRSTTGCGDAATAGWLWALSDGCSADETLRRIVACGTAKTASEDPGVLDAAFARKLLRKVEVRELKP